MTRAPDKTRQNPTVQPRKAKAIALVAAGLSSSATARQLGVSRQTVSQWSNDADGRAQIHQASQEISARIAGGVSEQLTSAACDAIDVLAHIMRHASNDGDRIRAAIYLCDRVLGKVASHVVASQQVSARISDSLEALPTTELARRLLAIVNSSEE